MAGTTWDLTKVRAGKYKSSFKFQELEFISIPGEVAFGAQTELWDDKAGKYKTISGWCLESQVGVAFPTPSTSRVIIDYVTNIGADLRMVAFAGGKPVGHTFLPGWPQARIRRATIELPHIQAIMAWSAMECSIIAIGVDAYPSNTISEVYTPNPDWPPLLPKDAAKAMFALSQRPAPVISKVTPTSVVVGTTTDITVKGSGLTKECYVVVTRPNKPSSFLRTQFVDEQTLIGTLDKDTVAEAGDRKVFVHETEAGDISNSLPLTIVEAKEPRSRPAKRRR